MTDIQICPILKTILKRLGLAKSSLKRIETGNYTERNYVHIFTPEPSHSKQNTVPKLKYVKDHEK